MSSALIDLFDLVQPGSSPRGLMVCRYREPLGPGSECARLSPRALQSHKETTMPNHPSTTARLTAVESYLEEEFPGRVEAAKENVFMGYVRDTCNCSS